MERRDSFRHLVPAWGLILLYALCNDLNKRFQKFHWSAMTSNFKGLYNKLNDYYHIYNVEANREQSNHATTKTEIQKGEKSGDSRGIVVWMVQGFANKREKSGG